MATQAILIPDWQLHNSKKGHFWQQNGYIICNFG